MESSIAEFLVRWSACERLPTSTAAEKDACNRARHADPISRAPFGSRRHMGVGRKSRATWAPRRAVRPPARAEPLSGTDGGQTSGSTEQLAGRDAALAHSPGRRSIGLRMSPRASCRGGWMRGCRSFFRAQGWRVVERASPGNEKLTLRLGPSRRAPIARRQCHHFSGSAGALQPQRDYAHTGHASSDADRSFW